MKKFISLLLICFLSLTLVSCGDKDNEVSIVPPSNGGGGGGGGTGAGVGGNGANLDSWNRVDVNLSSIVSWSFKNQYENHIQSTTTYVRPFVDRNRVRTIDMTNASWSRVSINDFLQVLDNTNQLRAEIGLVIRNQRIHFKKVSNLNGSQVRCAVLSTNTMTVVDIYSGNMVSNNNMNEKNIDNRPACRNLSLNTPFSGAYSRDLNSYYESYNVRNLVSKLSNVTIERMSNRNNNKFFKITGVKYDREFEQNLKYEYLVMAARGQYRVLVVKKHNYANKLVDSSYNMYHFENASNGNLYYDRSRVRTWQGGGFFFTTF